MPFKNTLPARFAQLVNNTKPRPKPNAATQRHRMLLCIVGFRQQQP